MNQSTLTPVDQAAQAGDVDTLYALLRENHNILQEIDLIPFWDTPLHVAASAGQTHIAIEIMTLKPSFARKLNQDGDSPMHLAVAKGNVETVKRLLEMDEDLACVKGREWKTPLHCAAIQGSTDVLVELISACPDSAKQLTVRRETALHLALKNDKFEAFEALVNGLSEENEEILNWKDEDGNTVLHLATYRQQRQTIELLLRRKVVEVNIKDANDLTALDISRQLPRETINVEIIENLLNAPRAQDRSTELSRIKKVLSRIKLFVNNNRIGRQFGDLTSEFRNAALVCASVIATVTFQLGINPPGGFWQDDFIPLPNNSGTSEKPHAAGQSILSSKQPALFFAIMYSNFASLFVSSMTITVLVSNRIRWLFLFPLAIMMTTYVISMYAASSPNASHLLISGLIIFALLVFAPIIY